ncbi:MAG: ABC transporter ATP-binding protein [Phycisphaerae bacterium]|nr:ABC transporter ATP-binding protein [Phycisphaerae bacterium]
MSDTVIQVRNISKNFGVVHAVRDLSFSVWAASCFGFLGPNGAGKTTMMKMLYGRNRCDGAGTMDIFGFDPRHDELAIKFLSGVVPQEDNLDDELDVTQNLRIYSKFYRLLPNTASQRIAELLQFMELSDKAHANIRELSGGMKRRLVIARALLNQPRLLILDEPTTGLDPQVRHLIWDKLRQLKKQGTTILLTTHYMEEAFALCDELIIMDRGSAILEGPPRRLLREQIERYVLEIVEGETAAAVSKSALPPSVRAEPVQNDLRLFADDIEILRKLAEQLHSDHFHLRQTNLEDVFLKATGRRLHETQ